MASITLKNNRYRIPYMGSKQQIAADLLGVMLHKKPKARYFYDLFGGGGAMSLCALDNGLKVHYNEIKTDLRELLEHALTKGLGEEFYQWISREDFKKYKEQKGYFGEFVRCVWSFGNSGGAYMFGKEIEHFKKHGHYVIMWNSAEHLELFKDHLKSKAVGELTKIFAPLKWTRRLEIWVNLIMKAEAIRCSKLGEKRPEFYNISAKDLYTMPNKKLCEAIMRYCPEVEIKNYKRSGEVKDANFDMRGVRGHKQLQQLQQLQQLEQLQRLEQLQQLEQLQRLQQLEQLQRLEPNISFSSESYENVKIDTPLEETIIYCDPPYFNTTDYKNEAAFDSMKFFKWAEQCPYSVFVSEYYAPSNLSVIFEKQKRALLASDATHTKSEKLLWNRK